jgi:hypothetical protein
MFLAACVFVLLAAATAATADDGTAPPAGGGGPERWLLERRDTWELPRAKESDRPADPLSRLIEHCRKNPVGVRPLVTLLPPDDAEGKAVLPTVAIFARAHGRTLVSLTHVRARADEGQDVVMQRTLVSDLLAGRRFSLTVYEDHAIGEAATRLMGVGTRLTFRPSVEVAGWRLRFEALGSYDLDDGPSGYLAVTGVLGAPPLPAAAR